MKDKVLEELQLSVAIVLSREEVVPRFRVMTLEGDWTLFVPLPDDLRERERRMALVAGFMAWKSAIAFVVSTELQEPDLVLAAGISRDQILCACRQIIRTPLAIGGIDWLPPTTIGAEVAALLPRGRVVLDTETEAALVRAFGTGGEFAAPKS